MASSDLGSLMRSIQSAGFAGGLSLPWCSGGTPGMDCSAAQHASGACIPEQAQEKKITACSICSWSSAQDQLQMTAAVQLSCHCEQAEDGLQHNTGRPRCPDSAAICGGELRQGNDPTKDIGVISVIMVHNPGHAQYESPLVGRKTP